MSIHPTLLLFSTNPRGICSSLYRAVEVPIRLAIDARPSPSLSCPCPQDVAATTTTLTMMMLMEARWHLAIKASETFRPDICITDRPFCEISPPRSFSAGCLSCCAQPAVLHLPELAKSAFISSQFPSSISVDRPLAAAPPPLLCRYFLSCFLPSLPLLLSQTSRWCTYIL